MKFLSRSIETKTDLEEWRQALREQQDRQILSSDMEELARRELQFDTRWIEHVPSGRFYRPWDGDPGYRPEGSTFYVTESGRPVILEPAAIASRAELEKKRAARDARRAARRALVRK